MSPKTGRPKLDNAKNTRIGVRLDDSTLKKLDELVESRKTSRSEVVRECIEKEYKDATK